VAASIDVNPTDVSVYSTPRHLILDVVDDGGGGSCTLPVGGRSDAREDTAPGRAVCLSRRLDNPDRAHITCSSSWLAEFAMRSDDSNWDLPLLYLLGHELSHVARRHGPSALMPAPTRLDLSNPPAARATSIAGYCDAVGEGRGSAPMTHEQEADADAIWMLRVQLDDRSTPGAGGLIPPERGGVGQIPSAFLDEGGRVLPRVPRGRSVPPVRLEEPFHAVAEALAARAKESDVDVVRPAILEDPPVGAPTRDVLDRVASDLLCQALTAPVAKRSLLLPTLPGTTHADGYARLMSVTRALDAIGSDREQALAAVDREIAAFTTGIVGPRASRHVPQRLRSRAIASTALRSSQRETIRRYARLSPRSSSR
jgi:hypothetical protein